MTMGHVLELSEEKQPPRYRTTASLESLPGCVDELVMVHKADDGCLASTETDMEDAVSASRPGSAAAGKMKRSIVDQMVDKDEIKAIIRTNMHVPVYDVRDFYHGRGCWQKIAKSSLFENVTLLIISANALYMWIDTDFNLKDTLLEADWYFQASEHFFCAYFSLEWFTRFMAFKRKRYCLRDPWFVFDTCLVGMMVAETWVMTVVMVATGVTTSGAGSSTGLLRLLRLLRLTRLARMLRSMPELMILIKGMAAATRSVLITLALLVIIMYIFAIIFRQLTDGQPSGLLYFRTIPDAMYTLLVAGTFLDGLAEVTTNVGNDSYLYAAIFFLFVLMGALTVMNMLIGVLCEVVSEVSATEREDMTVCFVDRKLSKIMTQIDADGNRRITRSEFSNIMRNQEAVVALREVGVDPEGLIDFVDFIFEGSELVDEDGQLQGEGEGLSLPEFVQVVLQFRGSNIATVKDIVDLRKFISAQLTTFEQKVEPLVAQVHPTQATDRSSWMSPSNSRFSMASSPERLLPELRMGMSRLEAFLGSLVADALLISQPNIEQEVTKVLNGLNGDFIKAGSLVHQSPFEDLPTLSERLRDGSYLALDELQNLRPLLPPCVSYAKQEVPLGVDAEASEQEDRRLLPSELRVCLAELEELLLTSWPQAVRSLKQSLPAMLASQELDKAPEFKDNSCGPNVEPVCADAQLAMKLKDIVAQLRKLRLKL